MASALRTVAHDDRLSLVEHLTELRVRIVISLVAFVACTALCFWQNGRVLDILNRPLTQTVQKGANDPLESGSRWDRGVAAWIKDSSALQRLQAGSESDPQIKAALTQLAARGDKLAATVPKVNSRKPVTLGVSEPFMQTLKVAAYAGLLLSLPIILFQIYAFVLPAFSPREKQIAFPAMLGVPLLFICGVVFGYYTVVPRAVEFLQNFNTDDFDVLVQAAPYYKFVLMLLLAMGLLFQIPIGIVAITRVGIVSTSQLAHNRRYAILVIAVLAMLLPGQDPVTMSMMMAPMYVLFEGSILLSWLLDRRAGRAVAEDGDFGDLEETPLDPEPVHVTRDQN
jgi:sec-independent protein translocase protein TatC